MSKLDGKSILLDIGGTVVVGQISGEMENEADMLDATTKDSTDGAKEYLSGETGWRITVDGLYDPAAAEGLSEAIGYLKAGTKLTVKYGQTGTGETQFSGSAYINRTRLSGPKNDLASYTLELQGDGVLTETTV